MAKSVVVSVITAIYNKEAFIAETLRSVINQTYPDWELIIIDDSSTDGSVEVVKQLNVAPEKFKLIVNHKNLGANYCRNVGINLARGKYLMFLDADDILAPECLQNRITEIEKYKVDFCVFSLQVFNKNPGDDTRLWIPPKHKLLERFLSHDLPWQTMQPIWKKEFMVKTGGFDESFSRLQDVELHTRILFDTDVKFKIIGGAPDCYYRIDVARKNYSNYDFLNRKILSTLQYCIKFHDLAKVKKLDYFLWGTIYKCYLELIFEYKIKNISKIELRELESKILNLHILKDQKSKKYLVKIGKYFATLPIRISGINWLISRILYLPV